MLDSDQIFRIIDLTIFLKKCPVTYLTVSMCISRLLALDGVDEDDGLCMGCRLESTTVPELLYLSTPAPPISPPHAERIPLRPLLGLHKMWQVQHAFNYLLKPIYITLIAKQVLRTYTRHSQ